MTTGVGVEIGGGSENLKTKNPIISSVIKAIKNVKTNLLKVFLDVVDVKVPNEILMKFLSPTSLRKVMPN